MSRKRKHLPDLPSDKKESQAAESPASKVRLDHDYCAPFVESVAMSNLPSSSDFHSHASQPSGALTESVNEQTLLCEQSVGACETVLGSALVTQPSLEVATSNSGLLEDEMLSSQEQRIAVVRKIASLEREAFMKECKEQVSCAKSRQLLDEMLNLRRGSFSHHDYNPVALAFVEELTRSKGTVSSDARRKVYQKEAE